MRVSPEINYKPLLEILIFQQYPPSSKKKGLDRYRRARAFFHSRDCEPTLKCPKRVLDLMSFPPFYREQSRSKMCPLFSLKLLQMEIEEFWMLRIRKPDRREN